MTTSMTTFYDLPDELILETVRHLSSIRSHEPQSTAFKNRDKEIARQRENHVRQLALHSLCLTSHRLRRIATPTLYASFLCRAGWRGFKPLNLFYRTISNPGCAVGMNVRLAEHVQYIENRLSDHLGNNLSDEFMCGGSFGLSIRCFYRLADVVNLAPNIQHLSVVSLEAEGVSFWNLVLPEELSSAASAVSNTVARHGFPKLQTLNLQIHSSGQDYNMGYDEALFRRICLAMTSVSSLTDLRVSGATTRSSITPLPLPFQRLQRLDFTECMLDFDEVLDVWSACEGLRHIACEWAYLDGATSTPSDLYPGLLRHSETLETIRLDMRQVRFQFEPAETIPLGSLRPFQRLKSLSICETALLGNALPLLYVPDQGLQHPIIEVLPETLGNLVLLFTFVQVYELPSSLDEILPLWHLAENCKTDAPKLVHVSVWSIFQLPAPNLTKAFNDNGLEFDVVKEATSQPSYD